MNSGIETSNFGEWKASFQKLTASKEIYDFIDENSNVLSCNVDKKYRSKSNIVFNFLKDEQNKKFVDAAKDIGIIGINGHRSVGGIRVSLFNSVDEDMFKFFMKFFKNYISELSNWNLQILKNIILSLTMLLDFYQIFHISIVKLTK